MIPELLKAVAVDVAVDAADWAVLAALAAVDADVLAAVAEDAALDADVLAAVALVDALDALVDADVAEDAALDADVITIETSRSDMELLDAFVKFNYPNDIGPGVYDIHSPRVPTSGEIEH